MGTEQWKDFKRFCVCVSYYVFSEIRIGDALERYKDRILHVAALVPLHLTGSCVYVFWTSL